MEYSIILFLVGIMGIAAGFIAAHFKNQPKITAYQLEIERTKAQLSQEQALAAEKIRHLEETRARLKEEFQAVSSRVLQDNTEHFLTLAKEVLGKTQENAQNDLAKRHHAIQETVKPLQEALVKMETESKAISERSIGTFAQLREQLHHLSLLQKAVQGETGKLVEAIRKPTVKGRWGEVTLRRVLENAGMLVHCDFIEQMHHTGDATQSGSLRPDVVLNLPENRYIIIDSKVPFDGYLNSLDALDAEQREQHMAAHLRQVKNHIKALGQKSYWEKINSTTTPEFVIMFVPAESAFAAALEADPTLLEHSWQHRVVLATPTTLMATIMAVAYSWKQEKMALHAEQAVAAGKELYARLAKFAEHFGKLGNQLNRSVESYNNAVASYETRLLPQAKRFEELQLVSTGKEASIPDQILLNARKPALEDVAE